MTAKIEKVGVIGAGVMGATIAAHMANVGLKALLLDIVPPKTPPALEKKGIDPESRAYRDFLARSGLEGALRSKPASFFVPQDAELVEIGNLDDDFQCLAECDWIIEVVVEILDIKKDLLSRLEKVVKPTAIVSTNTSGLSVADMSTHLSPDFQRRFLGTHFFNPPRYMKLFEIIPGPQTDPEVIDFMARFAEGKLGKGVVFCKDTPNFIANRIGVFNGAYTSALMEEMDLSIEQVDALTGTVLGRPKMATFRLLDLVGLDISGHVAQNVYERCPDDERREVFAPSAWQKQMVEKGLLGNKTKGGFYKKVKDAEGKTEILALDYKTLEYRPRQKAKFASLTAAGQLSGGKRTAAMYYGQDDGARFVFKLLSEVLIYAANRLGEISEDIVNIDNAMKWGFNWKLGPFETWDALGLAKSAAKMKEAGYALPAWVEKMLADEQDAFYKDEEGQRYYYDPEQGEYRLLEVSPYIIVLPSLKARGKLVDSNSGASLIDLGDDVLGLEFHSKMNAIGPDFGTMMNKACELVPSQFSGLVIANHGSNFSVGANLMLVLFAAQEEEWDELDFMVRGLQNALMRLKYLDAPVVAAPHQMALGGGCEIVLHSDKAVAAAETYIGLVEAGVGVVPAGGGCKELLIRNTYEPIFKVERGGINTKQINLLPFAARVFENIAMAKVATSAREAQKMGILRKSDQIVYNADHRIVAAKNTVQALNLMGYEPPRPLNKVRVLGRDAKSLFKYVAYNLHKAGYATDHDLVVADKLANVLCGGDVLPDTEVSEQHLLDLEREAFLSLCGTRATQARMAHTLKTGKPLRN